MIDDMTDGTTDMPSPEDVELIAERMRKISEKLLAESKQVTQLREAMETRDVIGQAKGLLMERFKINESEAFDLLRDESSQTNVKLRDVAARLTKTGTLKHFRN